MEFLYDLLVYSALFILGILFVIAFISALPYAILYAILDSDKPSKKDSTIKRKVTSSNGEVYEKTYSSDNQCEHLFDNRDDVSKCEAIQLLLILSFIGLLVGGVMSYFGDFAYKTLGISTITFLTGLLLFKKLEKSTRKNLD
ncbi:hypothetical protein [Thiomicrorhabdus sp.]|uniref:hypothetical protein n=1 Tax=Thiomicrorhabdus sp. TaxID=2039724 RepID=UPI002AA73495|nr:hypothetical protein [Thiomicrorhabdus sp.]